ncbi:MAG: 50S ribosomal protein L22 [Bacteroidetes bacterium]|nr:50S ribosomal protein L22 [Bacteroidota bacterium]
MGSRKRLIADQKKEDRKAWYGASLHRYPTSPRKMRLTADLIRDHDVTEALNILRYSKQHSARPLEKLLRSAIANWQSKNEGKRIEDAELFVQEITVDSGRMLKRVLPAPHGRAHRIMKRSNHVTLVLGDKKEIIGPDAEETSEQEAQPEPGETEQPVSQ